MDAIEEWFADKDSELEEIKSAFQGKAKVIWYEIAETEHPVDVFTRLNVGKIPLTNDELIRALSIQVQQPLGLRDEIQQRLRAALELHEQAPDS